MDRKPADLPREAPTREALTREERLAAKLRENLRRRKEQARSLQQPGGTAGEQAALPKATPKS
jgi:hypothetical protein